MQQKINWHGDLFTNEENLHYYHNKRLQVKKLQYLIPTYNWTLTLIPNWTCSVMTISHFQCMAPSMWLTNSMRGSHYTTYSPTWERCWLKSFLVYHTIKITKFLGHKTLWCTNIAASVSSHNLHKHNFASHLHNLWRPLKQFLYMFRAVRKESLNMYSWIEVKSALKN